MPIEEAVYWGQQVLLTTFIIAGPPMIAGLIIGTLIALFQAVTSVNEMTLVFVPKILVVFLTFLLLGPWMVQKAVTFGTHAFESIEHIE